MKKIAVYFLIGLFLLFALVLSCKDKPTPPVPPEIIIADNVVVIEEEGTVTLESIDSTTFTYSFVGDQPDIETGDILVGDEYGGYFRKASSITSQGNQLIIETEDAALVEAILQGSFQITDTLDWNSVNLSGDGNKQGKIKGGDGIELLPNGTIEFSNLQIFSDDYLDISISEGSLSFTPAIDIGGDIDFPGILGEFHALATGTVDVYADFYSISSRDYTISNEITIPGAQYEFGPFHIMIGFVPLWYSYELSLVAGFYYSSGAALETQHGFRNIASLTVGARYEDGDWDAVFDPRLELTDREVIWDKSDNVTLKCYIKPTLTMRFYSFLGPYLDAGPFLTLNGEVNYPQWQYDLNAGLESSLGFNVRFLSFELDAFNTVLYADSVTIASESGSAPSNSPPNPPSNPSPADNSEDQSVNTVLSWSCSDPDSGDVLSYDVNFGTSSSPPLVNSNQSQTTYDPGELNNGTQYFWQIAAKDNHQHETDGPLWVFTTVVEESTGTVTDIDGNTYQTVRIGDQWWMAENLKVTHYRNGNPIPIETADIPWRNLTTGAYCNYNNDVNNVAVYGRLYNWYAVNDVRNIAPEGWHVPSDAEWQTLVDYLGGNAIAGGKMKETGTTHWNSPNTGATNESGFTARAGGNRHIWGWFENFGVQARHWSTTEYIIYAWCNFLAYNHSASVRAYSNKTAGYSVRCVRD